MPSLSAKDRVSLCLFSYEDGRRCRTPRISSHPHFCFYHAEKESQVQSAEKLANELAYFFSGDYLSASDLSTALGRLIPAVVRGQIKPRLARTVAYMFQTQLQAIHLSQREYVNAFGADGWKKALRHSVTANHDYLHPQSAEPTPTEPAEETPVPSPQTIPTAPPPPSVAEAPQACHPEHSEGPWQDSASSTDDVTHLGPGFHPLSSPAEAALNIARNLFPERPNNTAPLQSEPLIVEPPTDPVPPTQTARPSQLAPEPALQSPVEAGHARPTRPIQPTRDPYAVHFDHTHRLYIDDKPF
jgi:hypothetical protein